MAKLVTTELNQMLNSLFEYIDWYKEYDASDDLNKTLLFNKYTVAISSLLLERKKKCEEYFEDVADQPIYKTDDYLRLRKFLVYWYSALSVLTEKEKQVSEINFIDKDLLLRSLGYDLYYLHSEANKETLATQLSQIWSEKGTRLAMAKVLSLTEISDFAMYEYWLEYDDYNNLVFRPVFVEGLSYSTGEYEDFKPLDKKFEKTVKDDPHWMTTEEDIIAAEEHGDIGLPSLSPYVGIASTNKWLENCRKAMAWINRVCDDIWNEYKADPVNFDISKYQKYYFSVSNNNVSIIELYVAAGYIYNKIFERSVPTREENTARAYFKGDESVLYDNVQYVSSYNRVFRRANSRTERDNLIKEIAENWNTTEHIFSENQNDNRTILETFNPRLLSTIDNIISIGDGQEVLSDTLMMLDYVVSHSLDMRCNFLYMLYESPKDRVSVITKIFDYFKPIHVRLIELITYIVLKDLPYDSMVMDEHFRDIIYQKLYDYYRLCEERVDMIITQDINDKIEYNTLPDYIHKHNYSMLMFDLVMSVISQDMHDYYICSSGDHDVKLNISQMFYEVYHVFDDVFIKENMIIRDNTFRLIDAVMYSIEHAASDRYNCNDDLNHRIIDEKVDVYRLGKDDVEYSFVERIKDCLNLVHEFMLVDKESITEMYRDIYFERPRYRYTAPCYENYGNTIKDSVTILENSSGIIFNTNSWTDSGEDYFITYDNATDSRISSVLVSVRDSGNYEVGVTTLYDDANNSISIHAGVPFNGSLILKEIDYRFDFTSSAWYYDNDVYTYTLSLTEHGIADGNYIVHVTSGENTTENLVKVKSTSDAIVLTAVEPFDGHILMAGSEVSKSFNSGSDWDWDPQVNAWRLALNPHLNGLNEHIKEYIAYVRNSEGEQEGISIRYDMIGVLSLITSIRIEGSVIIAGDLL